MVDQIKHVKFPQANQKRGAPEGWDEKKYGPCEGLYVQYREGVSTSKWRPTLRQLFRLALGKSIYLHVVGEQPPVALSVQ